MRERKWVSNFYLLIGSTLITLLLIEILLPKFLHWLPLEAHIGLDEGLLPLAQTSKKGAVPKDYIAVVGDSNAAGMGDWLISEQKKNNIFANPDFHSTHLLHKLTGRDIFTFGSAGLGSLNGLVAKPISQLQYIDSFWAFSLKKPKDILVYFYEGNDFTDNLRDLSVRYDKSYDADKIFDPKYFRTFIKETVLEKYPLYSTYAPSKNFIFWRFILKGTENAKKEIRRGIRKLKKYFNSDETIQKSSNIKIQKIYYSPPSISIVEANTVVMGGKQQIIPKRLSAGPMELTDQEIDKSVYVFEQALLFMADYFKDSSIKIVYIPSPASSYSLISPAIIKMYMDPGTYTYRINADEIYKKSDHLCRLIEQVANNHGIEFLDTRKFLRNITKTDFIHGPRDWGHLNKKGYHVLANSIFEAFYKSEGKISGFGCDTKSTLG